MLSYFKTSYNVRAVFFRFSFEKSCTGYTVHVTTNNLFVSLMNRQPWHSIILFAHNVWRISREVDGSQSCDERTEYENLECYNDHCWKLQRDVHLVLCPWLHGMTYYSCHYRHQYSLCILHHRYPGTTYWLDTTVGRVGRDYELNIFNIRQCLICHPRSLHWKSTRIRCRAGTF